MTFRLFIIVILALGKLNAQEFPNQSECYKYRINQDKSYTFDLDSLEGTCYLNGSNLRFTNLVADMFLSQDNISQAVIYLNQVYNFPCSQKKDDLFAAASFPLNECLRQKSLAGQKLIEIKKRYGITPDLPPAFLWQWEAKYIIFDPGKKVYLFFDEPFEIRRGPATLHTAIVRYDFLDKGKPAARVYLEELKRNLLKLNQDYYGESWLQRSNQGRTKEKLLTDHQAFIYSKGELQPKSVIQERASEEKTWEYGIAGNIGYFLSKGGVQILVVFRD